MSQPCDERAAGHRPALRGQCRDATPMTAKFSEESIMLTRAAYRHLMIRCKGMTISQANPI
jgi:hypothetical protein